MGTVAPLKASFMMTGIIGFLISVLYVYNISATWGVAFAVVFVLMFIASMISMLRASPDEQLHARPH